MRNWNVSPEQTADRMANSFQTTYEELKHSRFQIAKHRLRLPDYLWGIETPQHEGVCRSQDRFQTTYEELKLPFPQLSEINLMLPDYLWGIETFSFSLIKTSSSRFQTTYEELKLERPQARGRWRGRFQTTYEELKLSPTRTRRAKRTASRLPMRNWNLTFPFRSKTPNGLPDYLWGIETSIERGLFCEVQLPDYLWGIETPELFLHDRSKFSFQTTYEELKRLIDAYDRKESDRFQTTYEELKRVREVISLRSNSTSFQTTYEELKLEMMTETVCHLQGFQTTYEELKPWFWFISCSKGWASRLPMRNWNPSRKHREQHKPFFRFQTTYEELKQGYGFGLNWGYALPDYLWGIETSQAPPWADPRSCFQTTYEELKLKMMDEQREKEMRLPDYLWGIETARVPVKTCDILLPDYLWGIETHFGAFWHIAAEIASRLPMRNWNEK